MKQCAQCGTEYPDTSQFCHRDGQTLATADPMIGRVVAGRYRLTAKLGEGGMGAVYRGEHVRMRRPTAIKILAPSRVASPEFIARFEREAELASTINHPNAVAIYDFGEAEDGLVYLAMELLDGEALSAVLARKGRLPLALALTITRQAGEALAAAHRRGIVHRDFKPDNVMVCGDVVAAPVVKVVDFGIAKQTQALESSSALTQTGSVLGTPTYMSPEQVADHPLDARSDLYSLALTVYQMLSGTVPFRGDTAQAVMVKRLLEPPAPLRSVAPDVPPAVEAVVMKALAREPVDRHASVLDFVKDLELAGTMTQPGTNVYAVAGPTPTNTMPALTAPMTGAVTAQPSVEAVATPRRRVSAAAAVAVIGLLALPLAGYGLYRAWLAIRPPVVDPGPPPPPPQQESAEALVGRSRALRRDEQYDEAERAARRAVELDPRSSPAAVALADALLDLSRIAEARTVATRAVELDPKSPAAHRVLGSYYVRDRQFARAADSSRRALQLGADPEETAMAQLNLGDAYLLEARYDPAIEAYTKARAYTDWDLVPVLARVGIADAMAGKEQFDGAIREATAVAGEPLRGVNARAFVRMRLAKILLSAQRYAPALDECDRALELATLSPLKSGCHIVRGFALLALQRPGEALRETDEALDLAGEDRQLRGYAFAIRGVALVLQKRVSEGRDALTQATTLLPDDQNVKMLAAQVGAGT